MLALAFILTLFLNPERKQAHMTLHFRLFCFVVLVKAKLDQPIFNSEEWLLQRQK